MIITRISIIMLILSTTYIFTYFLKSNNTLNDKVKKIKKRRATAVAKPHKLIGKLSSQLAPIVSAFYDQEKIRYKLIQSGGALSHFGITEDNFLAFEILFGSVTFLIVLLSKSSIIDMVLYPAVAILLVESIVKMSTRERQEKIRKELEALISSTKEFIAQGMEIRDAMALLPTKVNSGPLRDELLRLNSRLGVLKVDVGEEKELLEFAKRIGLEEIDNYVLALAQHEVSGRVTRMLEKQVGLLRSRRNQRVKRETANRERVSSLAAILMVLASLMVLIVPMVVSVLQNKLFHS